ncbi:MAG: hypothetical protein ACREK1_06440 [Longimicrobiales bacterium]
MDPELRTRAEARLAEAATAQDLADPRPAYRERLRQLRQTRPDAFNRAIEHYEKRVLPALSEDEPLRVWLEYGRFLASLTGEGQAMQIDAAGRAAAWTPGSPAGLVLFIPVDDAADILVLSQPAAATPAQHATLALLVERRLSG